MKKIKSIFIFLFLVIIFVSFGKAEISRKYRVVQSDMYQLNNNVISHDTELYENPGSKKIGRILRRTSVSVLEEKEVVPEKKVRKKVVRSKLKWVKIQVSGWIKKSDVDIK